MLSFEDMEDCSLVVAVDASFAHALGTGIFPDAGGGCLVCRRLVAGKGECRGLVGMAQLIRALRVDDDPAQAIVAADHPQGLHETDVQGYPYQVLLEETLEVQEHLRFILVVEEDGIDVRTPSLEPLARSLTHAALVDAECAHALGDLQCSVLLFLERYALPHGLAYHFPVVSFSTDDDDRGQVSAPADIEPSDITRGVEFVFKVWVHALLHECPWELARDLPPECVVELLVEADLVVLFPDG